VSGYKSILTLDLARRTGFATWRPGSLPEIGTYTLPEPIGGIGLYLQKYEDWLRSMCARRAVDCLVFEAQILIHGGKNKTGFEVAYQLMNLGGTTEKVCQDLNICCSKVQVTEWRKHFLGSSHHRTKDAKDLAMKKARACGFDPKHHDAAEAFGILDYTAAVFDMKTDWPDANIFGGRV